MENRPTGDPCLLALTGQSNISNSKNPLSICSHAKALGFYTLLDAAALAATSTVNLSETPVDAMAVSFYKMFGFPTGVGALVVKEDFLRTLQRPWFAGGTVDVVQVPGSLVTMAGDLVEQFEVRSLMHIINVGGLLSTSLGRNNQLSELTSYNEWLEIPNNLSPILTCPFVGSSPLYSEQSRLAGTRFNRLTGCSYSFSSSNATSSRNRGAS